ncbi:MAG: hypothetical protein K2X69_16490 [Silvanigrellaceae bacterium]|nr:hypothetical protein [Silvanigrellaceae bacterium]
MSKINCSKSNGTMFEQIGLALIAMAGKPYFANNGYIATSDEDISRWVENDYPAFTRYLKEEGQVNGFSRGWSVQGKIHLGEVRIDPDFFSMEKGRIFEFKYQESVGSMVEKLFKNILTYQAVEEPSFIVYHGKGFNDRFFNSVEHHRPFLKKPDITQFITILDFAKQELEIELNPNLKGKTVSITTDRHSSNLVRKKHPKLKDYTERVIYEVNSKKELYRFKTLQLLDDAKSDGFKDNNFFKNCVFTF